MNSSEHKRTPGPISISVLGLALAAFCVLAIRIFGLPAWTPILVGTVALGAWLLLARLHAMNGFTTWYVTACVAFEAGWISWTAWMGFSTYGAIALLTAAVAAGFLALGLRAPVAAAAAGQRSLLPVWRSERPESAELRRLLNWMLNLQADKGMQTTAFEMWPEAAGYTAVIEGQPGSRVTLEKIQPLMGDLASELKLKKGCTINVTEGDHAASFVFKVALVNNLEQDAMLDTNCRPRSVKDPFPIGNDGAGKPKKISVYQHAVLICAPRGAGKSVLQHGVVKNLAECTDNLTWFIDLKNGATVAPWLNLWARGMIDRPIIDWPARDEDEALLIAEAAYALALDRNHTYSPLMHASNTDILPISADIPAVNLIIDEGHLLFGPKASRAAARAGEIIIEMLKLSRSMCVNVVFSSQRTIGTYMPTDLKTLTGLKLAGRFDNQNDLGQVFDWELKGIRHRHLTGPGQWFVQEEQDAPTKIKTYGVLPSDADKVALATHRWQARLDEPGLLVVGEAYAQRWERLRPWMDHIAGRASAVPTAPPPRPAIATPPPVADLSHFEAAVEELKVRVQQENAAPPAEPEEPEFVWTAAGFDALPVLAEPRNVKPAEKPAPVRVEPDLPAGEAFAYKLVRAAGTCGAKTGEIFNAAQAAGMVNKRRGTVNDWLAALRTRGLVTSPEGSHATWVAVDPDE